MLFGFVAGEPLIGWRGFPLVRATLVGTKATTLFAGCGFPVHGSGTAVALVLPVIGRRRRKQSPRSSLPQGRRFIAIKARQGVPIDRNLSFCSRRTSLAHGKSENSCGSSASAADCVRDD